MRKYIKGAGKLITYFTLLEPLKRKKEEGSSFTVGWDDTLKKRESRLWDIKTGHVTIVDKDKKRTTLSFMIQQNISYKGEDSAESVKSTVT